MTETGAAHDRPTAVELEELAKSVSSMPARLSHDFQPIVVEFAGSPKSGKTTTIDIVSHFYKRSGFSIWAPSEGASKRTPYHLRSDLAAFNAWTLNYAISELLVTYHDVDRPAIIFLDRGPFDSLAWMGVLRKRGELAEEEFAIIKKFALLEKWSGLVSRLYLFTCAVELSLDRENDSKLITRPGTAMNHQMLDDLREEYSSLAEELKALYPVKGVQTSNDTTPLGTSFEVAVEIRDLLEDRLNGKD